MPIVNSNKSNHKNKIGKLKYNDIVNVINNIKNNAISETLAKKNLNALNEIKKAEIKNKRLIPSQKQLLNFFDNLLDIILTEDNNNNNNRNNNNNNSNNNSNNYENKNENKSDYKIKQINNYFKNITESNSFEDQINLFKKMDYLDECSYTSYYDDDKEWNLKIFKLKFAYISNDIHEKLFQEVFGHTFVTLANKLINRTNKKENQITVNDIKNNMDKLYEHDAFHNYVIKSSSKRIDLINAARLILRFNEIIQLDGDW